MLRCALVCAGLMLAAVSCNQDNPNPTPTPTPTAAPAEPFAPSVDPAVLPTQPAVIDSNGAEQAVCASRDMHGVQSDFVEGVVLLRPKSAADLSAFLARYDGVIIDDDTIPEPPPELGITLTEAERAPTEYVVRVNLALADAGGLPADAAALGLEGNMAFTSQGGLDTFAQVLDARVAGFSAAANYVSTASQALPVGAIGVFLNTQERQTAPGVFTDAFSEPRFGATGSRSNVTLAWQFLFAHGIQRRVRVAIIDAGFWLDANGRARGPNSDFPTRPVQYDFVGEDANADGPGTMGCGAGNPCYWHGTGSASVATGIVDNRLAYAGTGGLVADPLLFKFGGPRDQRNQAIRTAVAWGADVVSMSFGGDCNLGCRIGDRDETPFSDAVDRGSKAAFIAAAGNGRGTPAAGYDVGAPSFVHPCLEDHVICVGALADNTQSIIGYSNFGSRVTIFAPTNIPAMSYPNSFDAAGNPLPIAQASGPEMTQPSFGGTSAATPFVAGVVAMMKALNPELTGDQINQILVETAQPGTPPATRCIDALACVRRAAEGLPIRDDRFEINDLEDDPTDLGAAAPYSAPNLNIDAADRDYFRFTSPGGATMTLNLQYPQGLGDISVFNLASLGGDCTSPALLADTPLPNATGRTLTYTVPGGPLLLSLDANDVNAYNLGISFAASAFAPDIYEPNETHITARYLYSLKPVHIGVLDYFAIDSRVSIDATLHSASDVDYYLVRGVAPTTGESVLLVAVPAVLVYNNDSPLNVAVYNLNADNSQGTLVGSVASESCAAESATIRLEKDRYYLVRVSGAPGGYRLTNGVSGDPRKFPLLVRDRIYDILHPGDPVEQVIRYPEVFAFVPDRAYAALVTPTPSLHLRLYDFNSNIIAEGLANGGGERLSLAPVAANQVYALELIPADDEVTAELAWEPVEPGEVSDNLIVNGNAETTIGDPASDIPAWTITAGEPRIFFYNDEEPGPSLTDPGPEDRGDHLFAGGPNSPTSAIQQLVSLPPAWRTAIDGGSARFRFNAFLGGSLDATDAASATVTFYDDAQTILGAFTLPAVTPLNRDNQSGLLPVEVADAVPAGSTYAIVELTFVDAGGNYNYGFADNVVLELLAYPE